METSSFIPKKSFEKPFYRPQGLGLLLGSSVVLLVVSALLFGGVYFYKNMLEKRVNTLAESLKRAQNAFEPSLILKLNDLADRIKSSENLLSRHKAAGNIFKFLEESTLQSVRFTNFSYKLSKDQEPEVLMKGTAKNYSSLALQVEEFQKNEKVKNIAVSGLFLGDGGIVNFNIDLVFEPDFIKYNIK